MDHWKKYTYIALALLLWTGLHIAWQYKLQIPNEIEGKTIRIEGVVLDHPVVKATSTQFIFLTKEYGKLQLNWYQNAPVIKKNQRWALHVRLKKPRSFKNPGGFNYARFLFFKRITASGYIDIREPNILLYEPSNTFDIRLHIAEKIDSVLELRPNAALIKGLAVGIRDTMTDAQWELLQKTGTSHLLAISGLHIGLVSGLVFFFLRRAWALVPYMPLKIPAPQMAAFVAMISAFIYALLAGFAIPTQRALIMIAVVMLCIIARFRFKNRHILFFAGFLVAIWDPFALLSASFWLSFLAVGLLFILSLQEGAKWQRFISIQWFISIGLTPLVIVYFQQISWVSPLANFIAIPWASFTVVPFTLLGVLASMVDLRLAMVFWLLAESALNYLQWLLALLADMPWSAQTYVVSDVRVWLAIIIASLLLLLPKGVPDKALGLLLLLAIFFVSAPKPKMGEVWLSVLDVGQGLAVVVQTANHVLLYDAGMRFDEFDLGEVVILPFLQHQGIQQINMLVLSHDNLDHTGGAQFLIDHMPVANIKSGEAIRQMNVEDRCIAGQAWAWDEVYFEFLYPPSENNLNSNDSSCVLKITTGEYSALLTGDIEKAGEAWLVKHVGLHLKTDILLAPHHGSRTSSTLPFVQLTLPEHVVFSTGYRNRYQFPREDVVTRYSSRGAKVYNTADLGAVRFKFSSEGIGVNHK